MKGIDAAESKRRRLRALVSRLTAPNLLPTDLDYEIAVTVYVDGLATNTASQYFETVETLGIVSIDWNLRIIDKGPNYDKYADNSK